jgi:hypothetical protein
MAAHIYTGTITNTSSNFTSQIYNFISQYDNRFTFISADPSIQFSDKFKVSFQVNTHDVVVYDLEGNTISTYSGRNNGFTAAAVTFITSANFVSFRIAADQAWHWIIQGNEDFFSMMYRSWYGFDVDNTNQNTYFTRISTAAKNCIVPKNFNYTVVAPKMMFANHTVMIDTSGYALKLDGLQACSTVPTFSTVTVNNKNYYAVGTNTLVEVEA